VIVVMTDDQPYGAVSKMPALSGRTDFTRFTKAFDNNPLCCPARATFLSGLYSHHTGVITNSDGASFDPSHTLATAFDDAGYETALIGKYLNDWPFDGEGSNLPPGWDRWVAFSGEVGYYDYVLNVDGVTETHGSSPSDYSTDVLADRADAFIAGAARPFFMLYTPKAPHAPYTPAPRHRHAYDDAEVSLRPNFNRVQSDPHPWWADRPRIRKAVARKAVRRQWETLLAVDEALVRFFATLESEGELDNTIVLFLTDNGYSLGSHRWMRKQCLYDECAHTVQMIRAPGITDGGRVAALVSNIDLAPTLSELAGLSFGQTDGVSLVPLLNGDLDSLHRPLLLQTRRDPDMPVSPPSAWGLRTNRYKYVRHNDGEVDLFDLRTDRFELDDVARDERYTEVRRRLRHRLEVMRRNP
jgi:arylsulfatase A-like enzyme